VIKGPLEAQPAHIALFYRKWKHPTPTKKPSLAQRIRNPTTSCSLLFLSTGKQQWALISSSPSLQNQHHQPPSCSPNLLLNPTKSSSLASNGRSEQVPPTPAVPTTTMLIETVHGHRLPCLTRWKSGSSEGQEGVQDSRGRMMVLAMGGP
jgi:hypothetical protein